MSWQGAELAPRPEVHYIPIETDLADWDYGRLEVES